MKEKKTIQSINDLQLDDKNANKGTFRGRDFLEISLKEHGAGRSILTDAQGNIIAGNKTAEVATELGLDVRVVETDGKELVVVQRTDLDIDSVDGRRLAIADNRTGEVGLDWDTDTLKQLTDELPELNIGDFFNTTELEEMNFKFDFPKDEVDHDAEWNGMPELIQDDSEKTMRTLLVHFKTQEDINTFAELVKQSITEKTSYLYFPEQKDRDLKALVYDDE